MMHFLKLHYRALLYHLRMQQGFTNAQIRGSLVLLAIMISLCSFSWFLRQQHEKQEELTVEERQAIDSLLEAASHKPAYQKYKPRTFVQRKNTAATTVRDSPGRFISLNLNEADSLQLLQLNGIGPVLASRILKFRKALGGFYAKEQLYEIWGLDSSVTKKILPLLFVKEKEGLSCLKVNEADYIRLKNHPYISPAEASQLMKYKKQKGKFLSLSDLEPMLTQFDKLKYYLCLD